MKRVLMKLYSLFQFGFYETFVERLQIFRWCISVSGGLLRSMSTVDHLLIIIIPR